MQFKRLKTEAEVRDHIHWLNANLQEVVLDTETTGLSHFTDRLLAIVLSGRTEQEAVCFDAVWASLINLLRVPRVVLHNFKFDALMLSRVGVDLRLCGEIWDTMLLDHLYDENESHALDAIVQRRYGDAYKQAFWSKYKTFEQATDEDALTYMCKDVIYTGRVYRDLLRDLQVPKSLIRRHHELAIRFYDTELTGLRVDLDYLIDIGAELKPKIADFTNRMRESAPNMVLAIETEQWAKEIDDCWTPNGKKWKSVPRPEFNWDSGAQVGGLLYDKLKIPEQTHWVKRKVGPKVQARTVDDEALEKIKHWHPIVEMLQEYRVYQKVFGAFIEGTLERVNNGYVYPEFNINGTVTGRISSSNPNMQQLPASGDWAKVRGIYLPDMGDIIVSRDYSQLEVVIAAHFSHDPNLLKIVYEGASKHDITAAGVGLDRKTAKTLNFAMQYQCTPKKVAEICKCSMDDAKYIWNKYWETYEGEKKVIDECKAKVDSGAPIINPFGRRRHFPTEFEKPWHKEAAYRQAYSSLIQGTGSDCTHGAFINTGNAMQALGLGRSLFEVHDEIVTSSKKDKVEEVSQLLSDCMISEGAKVGLSVPLSVGAVNVAERWTK